MRQRVSLRLRGSQTASPSVLPDDAEQVVAVAGARGYALLAYSLIESCTSTGKASVAPRLQFCCRSPRVCTSRCAAERKLAAGSAEQTGLDLRVRRIGKPDREQH